MELELPILYPNMSEEDWLPAAQQLFQLANSNGDGFLSGEEFFKLPRLMALSIRKSKDAERPTQVEMNEREAEISYESLQQAQQMRETFDLLRGDDPSGIAWRYFWEYYEFKMP